MVCRKVRQEKKTLLGAALDWIIGISGLRVCPRASPPSRRQRD
jgi:hypothetical protein